MMPKRTRILKILIPLLGILIPLAGAELFLRLSASSKTTWTPQKQLQLIEEAEHRYPPHDPFFSKICLERPSLQHQTYSILGSRLREYDYPQAKPVGSYRILGLGDSFAWGWGVFDNRRVFFKLLECWLQLKNPSRLTELINASQPGASAAYYQRYMRVRGYNLNPDMVMISFNLNDAYVKRASITIDQRTTEELTEEKGFWTKHFRLVHFFRERFIRTRMRREFIANVHNAYFLGPERAQRWQRAQANLLAIASGCRQRGIALKVIVFPLLVDLDRRYPFTKEIDEIVRFCQQNGIDSINLLPTFLGKKSELLWTLPSNAHPNEVANRLAAEAIFSSLGPIGPGPLSSN
ncbi:MAG TPA: hypothetical protein VMZ49_06475 [Patescibacteria group bacterium]|nr:hypothetical protein [Patescibacteria group bacterium]